MIIYDIEIVKGILGKKEQPLPDIQYCAGWDDHANMGISTICAYDYAEDRYRVFCKDNFESFQDLVDSTDIVAGFNSIAFDNRVCAAHGIVVRDDKSYDLLVEIWKAHGLDAKFKYPSYIGYSLDAMAVANLGRQKTGHGALAPVQWQRGEIGSVFDYCLTDVWLTKKLIDLVIKQGELISPVKNYYVKVQPPYQLNLPEESHHADTQQT